MSKFLVITNHSYMLWQFRKELLQRLVESYDDVVVCTPFNDRFSITNLRELGCRCIKARIDRRGINPLKDIELYRYYYALIKKEKPDKVLTISIKPNIYAGFACSLLDVPYYTLIQGLGTAFEKKIIATVATELYKKALTKAKIVFFENRENADLFVEKGIVDRKKIKVLNGAGVNISLFNYEDYPEETSGINFLYIGRLMREKGVLELIETFNLIKDDYKINLFLVGFFEDDFKEILSDTINKNSERIELYGFTKTPQKFYKSSHCVIVPSYHEGMNNVLLEASSTGRAVITTNISGCKEIVEENVTGFLCKPQDIESLRNCMIKFLEKTSEERKEMGIKAREKVSKEFNKMDVVETMLIYLVD